MILRVPFELFARTAERFGCGGNAYVQPRRRGCLITAAEPKSGVIVLSISDKPQADVCRLLEQEDMQPFEGVWMFDTDGILQEEEQPEAFIGAVAYQSEADEPGLWVDAYPTMPTQAQVLRGLYEDFQSTGEVNDQVSFEEFVRLAKPTVVVVSPNEVRSFVGEKSDG